MRKFKEPTSQQAWEDRLGFSIPWKKVWKIRTFFATPRDQVPWLKLHHRNLYVAGHDPVDSSCRACSAVESQMHLCKCGVIRKEFWDPLIKVATETGMPAPHHTTAFLAVGLISADRVISKFHSGIFFLGWRSLYAAIIHSRVDNVALDLEEALKRTVSMVISRLRAYALFWSKWVNASRYRKKPNRISQKHSNKKVITQKPNGTYAIHPKLWELASKLNLL